MTMSASWSVVIASWPSGVSSLPARIGVLTAAGISRLTPMPRSTYIAASHSVKPTAACLVTVYPTVSKITSRPAADATLSRYPLPCSSMCGIAYFAANTSDIRLTLMIFCHFSVGMSIPPSMRDPGVGDEQVDPPEAVDRGRHEALDVLLAADVGRDWQRADRHGLSLAGLLVEVRQHDVRPLLVRTSCTARGRSRWRRPSRRTPCP